MARTSIFNNTKNPEDLYMAHISQEMIAPQINDYVVPLIKDEFNALFETCSKLNITTDHELYSNTKSMNHIKNISNLLEERIGINFEFINAGETCPAGILPVTSKEFNVLFQNTGEQVQEELKTLMGIDKDLDKTLRTVLNSYKELSDVLHTKQVIIDLEKAKIKNLPKGFKLIVYLSPIYLKDAMGVDSNELTAILFHEVGHGFTYLENMYRQIIQTTVLTSTMLDNISNKNKTVKESIIISYQKATKDMDISKLKDGNDAKVSLLLMKKYLDGLELSSQPYSSIDSEQLADQFAGRFGLAADLASGLAKIKDVYNSPMTMLPTVFTLTLFSVLSFVAAAVFMGVVFLGMATVVLYSYIFRQFGIKSYLIYDKDSDRFKRIRLELIRQLRSLDLDKNVKDTYLNRIELLDKFIATAKDGKLGIIDSFYQTFMKSGQMKLEMRTLQQMTESLMENNLHIATAKLENLA